MGNPIFDLFRYNDGEWEDGEDCGEKDRDKLSTEGEKLIPIC